MFLEILDEARAEAIRKNKGKTIINSYVNNEWRQFGKAKLKRPLSSVILDDGVSERIVSDLERFLSRAKWYQDRGVPYRRGYLFHGPPGTQYL